METIVIAGAGVAGGRAAETLRAEGFDGRILLIGAEPDRPYERPPLSKDFLSGQREREKLFLRSAAYYQEQRIELLTGHRATHLMPDRHQVTVEGPDGSQLYFYDKLLIATGVSSRRLSSPGSDLPGIRYLRTIADVEAIRAYLHGKRRIVVVGGGFIGTEAAASFSSSGHDVVLLEMLDHILSPLGPRLGEVIGRLHRERGIDLRLSEKVDGFEGKGGVERVLTANGDSIPADFVLVGIGSRPETGWLSGSGIAVQGGVLTDELNRTNVESVYAAGDVASWWHPDLGERLTLEHFDHGQNHGVAAAMSMLDSGEPYRPVPTFWTDQYEKKLQLAGLPRPEDRIVFRGDPDGESWSAFYFQGDAFAAVLACNRFPDYSAGRRILEKKGAITPAEAADESFDLRAFARSLR